MEDRKVEWTKQIWDLFQRRTNGNNNDDCSGGDNINNDRQHGRYRRHVSNDERHRDVSVTSTKTSQQCQWASRQKLLRRNRDETYHFRQASVQCVHQLIVSVTLWRWTLFKRRKEQRLNRATHRAASSTSLTVLVIFIPTNLFQNKTTIIIIQFIPIVGLVWFTSRP